MSAPEPFSHQLAMRDFALATPRMYNASDPGTGKTRGTLMAMQERTLVLCPKSIMHASWVNDCHQFRPDLSVGISRAGKHREQPFADLCDVVVTNHDATTWLQENPRLLRGFRRVVMDEMTAFKHRTSARASALAKIIDQFDLRIALSGTPTPNGVLDMWHQAYLLDGGERLGRSFYAFRNAACRPEVDDKGRLQWVTGPGSAEAVADLMSDITIRYRLEDCTDIPENQTIRIEAPLSPQTFLAYRRFANSTILDLQSGAVSAIHAGDMANKLLQYVSGSVYDGLHVAHRAHSERYELIADLCEQYNPSIIACIWTHQSQQLFETLTRRGFRVGVLSNHAPEPVHETVAKFQGGAYDVVLGQPKLGSHGLTLTRGRTTIWASPTHNLEHYIQFNHRAYRTGQTQRTTTIQLVAPGTLETDIYDLCLAGKSLNSETLLRILTARTASHA